MKNFTAQSNLQSSEKSRAHSDVRIARGGAHLDHQARNSQHQPGVRKTYKPPVIDARLFYDPADGRKWKRRCEQKRTVWIALLDISHGSMKTCAVEKQIGKLKGIPSRTVRRIIRWLRTQGFMRVVRKHGLYGALERELLPDRLGRHPSPNSECGRTSTSECGRVTAVKQLQLGKDFKTDTTKTVVGPCKSFLQKQKKETAAPPVVHTPQTACDAAYWFFMSPVGLELGEDDAYALVCWILYRALRAGTMPRTLSYFIKSAENFFKHYTQEQGIALLKEAEGRYDGKCKPKRLIEEQESKVDRPKVLKEPREKGPWEKIDIEPIGSDAFCRAWEYFYAGKDRAVQDRAAVLGELLSARMQRTIQHCQGNGVRVPAPFFAAKRLIEEREMRRFSPKTPSTFAPSTSLQVAETAGAKKAG
jgi:hypothetical protein